MCCIILGFKINLREKKLGVSKGNIATSNVVKLFDPTK
jgi:hypothetical protein